MKATWLMALVSYAATAFGIATCRVSYMVWLFRA